MNQEMDGRTVCVLVEVVLGLVAVNGSTVREKKATVKHKIDSGGNTFGLLADRINLVCQGLNH